MPFFAFDDGRRSTPSKKKKTKTQNLSPLSSPSLLQANSSSFSTRTPPLLSLPGSEQSTSSDRRRAPTGASPAEQEAEREELLQPPPPLPLSSRGGCGWAAKWRSGRCGRRSGARAACAW